MDKAKIHILQYLEHRVSVREQPILLIESLPLTQEIGTNHHSCRGPKRRILARQGAPTCLPSGHYCPLDLYSTRYQCRPEYPICRDDTDRWVCLGQSRHLFQAPRHDGVVRLDYLDVLTLGRDEPEG